MENYPKISIVVVNYNLGNYLEECLLSILNQQYPNLELILIDGGSTDESIKIIEKHQQHFSYWVSETDQGQYDAVQKGFNKASGEIMAWINSDDKYLTKSLFAVAEIFSLFPEVNWLMGRAMEYTDFGALVGRINIPWCRWSKYRYYTNDYQFIQQESCFWRKSLWETAGAKLDTNYKLAADLELWTRFFRFEKLHTTTLELAGFRHRKNKQRSKDFLKEYLQEAKIIIKNEKKKLDWKTKFKLPFMHLFRWVFGPQFFFDSLFSNKIYPFLFGIPKLINYDFELHEFVKKDLMIQHPPMVFGKYQIHRKTFQKKK